MSFNRDMPVSELLKKFILTFNFDWNNYKTIKISTCMIIEVEKLINEALNVESELLVNDKYMLAQLCYQIGTFYNHINQMPDKALPKLQYAEKILVAEELAWVKNHLAFTYHQKQLLMKANGQIAEPAVCAEKSVGYCNESKAIIILLPIEDSTEKRKISAFANFVHASVEYAQGCISSSINFHRMALDDYENIKIYDDQYARIKSCFAMVLADNGDVIEAQQSFEELDEYWSKQVGTGNPYAARFFDFYGDFLAKHLDEKLKALLQYKKAYTIASLADDREINLLNKIKQKILSLEERLYEKYSHQYALIFYRPLVKSYSLDNNRNNRARAVPNNLNKL